MVECNNESPKRIKKIWIRPSNVFLLGMEVGCARVPDAWGDLEELTDLYITDQHRIQGTLPAQWSRLTNLEYLLAYGNDNIQALYPKAGQP